MEIFYFFLLQLGVLSLRDVSLLLLFANGWLHLGRSLLLTQSFSLPGSVFCISASSPHSIDQICQRFVCFANPLEREASVLVIFSISLTPVLICGASFLLVSSGCFCSSFVFSLSWLRWLRGESVCLRCGRPGFYPWVGKIPWRRKWQPTPVFLPGESRGRRSLAAAVYGVAESDTAEAAQQQQQHWFFSRMIDYFVCGRLRFYLFLTIFCYWFLILLLREYIMPGWIAWVSDLPICFLVCGCESSAIHTQTHTTHFT